jgi:hypothetical protein
MSIGLILPHRNLGAFPALRAGNRAFRSNSSGSADALPCGISASIPVARPASAVKLPRQFYTYNRVIRNFDIHIFIRDCLKLRILYDSVFKEQTL